jgi:hypothetical protein
MTPQDDVEIYLAKFKAWFAEIPKHYIYLPLLAGVVTPPLVLYVLQSMYGPQRYVSVIQPGEIMFCMIPFVALVALMVAISSRVTRVRRELIFWGGFIPAWGFTAYYHWIAWYPIFMGKRMSSTFAIAFLFIVLYSLFYSAIGVLIGLGVSFLPWLSERKK